MSEPTFEEPLSPTHRIYDIMDRYIHTYGVPPARIDANRGFKHEFFSQQNLPFAWANEILAPGSDFIFCGVLVCCRIPTKQSVLFIHKI